MSRRLLATPWRRRVRGARRTARLTALAVVAAVVVAACGRGSDPPREWPATLDEPARALLLAADLPPGWSRHEPLRASSDFPLAPLRATASAPRAGHNPYVAQSVDVYEPGGGRQAMAMLRKLFAPGVTHSLAFPTEDGGTRVRRVFFWRLPPPKLGDESFAVWFDAADGSKGAFVAIRQGDAITMIRHFTSGTTGAPVDGALTRQLARLASERLAQALALR